MNRERDVLLLDPVQSVPCNGCTACCEHDLIVLHPDQGDRPDQYLTTPARHPLTGKPVLALQRQADGSCVYLERGVGCTIHDRAPLICREFDCRRFVQRVGKEERRAMLKAGIGSRRVYQAGFDRLHTLDRR